MQEINSVSQPKPFSDSKTILKFLKQNNIKMVVISSHPKTKLKQELKDYGFQEFFIDINGGVHDKIKTIKQIMKKNRFKAATTAYIGDMIHDIKAGKKAGVTTIAISRGYQTKKELLSQNPDFLINSLKGLKKIS